MTTTYSQRINALADFSIESVIDDCIHHLPAAYVQRPWCHQALNHGKDLLSTDDALDCYMAAYGEMHHIKMLAALQNFPFERWNSPDSQVIGNGGIHIVDWGCGQGIGSMTLIDLLKKHELLKFLRRVTLIEPSRSAIERAELNVRRMVGPYVRVHAINEYLPGATGTMMEGVDYGNNNVVHIFSNILDVDGIHLANLARLVATSAQRHYIVCAGPYNPASVRIDRFCEIFGKQTYFSQIEDKCYGFLCRTGHPFTCKTKCFEYDGGALDYSRYRPDKIVTGRIYGEYDVNRFIADKTFSNGKAWAYYKFQLLLRNDDMLYISPKLKGATPDFMIVRPGIGILLVNVFEGAAQDKNIKEANKKLTECQDVILGDFPELTKSVIKNVSNLGMVKKLLVCTNSTAEEAISALGSGHSYTMVVGKEFIARDDSSYTKLFDKIGFTERHGIFNTHLMSRIRDMFSAQWHSFREGVQVNLTPVQRRLAKSEAGRLQKISGVAGSGKTQVMCTRAVNAQLRTGGKVLLLTFNIALANYIRMRVGQVRADFPWPNIKIDYYCRFFREVASCYRLGVRFESYDDPSFFDSVKDRIEKYEAIFIDEVQDYKDEWLRLLYKTFLKPGGEFVVFGDPSQNIYDRPLTSKNEISISVVPGVWNRQLLKSFRFGNPALTTMTAAFRSQFKIEEAGDASVGVEDVQESLADVFTPLSYESLAYDSDMLAMAQTAYERIVSFLSSLPGVTSGEVAVLCPRIELLKELEWHYRHVTGAQTTVTFPAKEEVEEISHNTGILTWQFKQDYKRLDRSKKMNFTTNTPNMKFSTIQSFKGWESGIAILIIVPERPVSRSFQQDQLSLFRDKTVVESENLFSLTDKLTTPEMVYTGLTRAKDGLLVLNFGCLRYHSFFEKYFKS